MKHSWNDSRLREVRGRLDSVMQDAMQKRSSEKSRFVTVPEH